MSQPFHLAFAFSGYCTRSFKHDISTLHSSDITEVYIMHRSLSMLALACVAYKAGDKDDAVALLEEALSSQPDELIGMIDALASSAQEESVEKLPLSVLAAASATVDEALIALASDEDESTQDEDDFAPEDSDFEEQPEVEEEQSAPAEELPVSESNAPSFSLYTDPRFTLGVDVTKV